MSELILKFTDENGEAKEILVEGEVFEIGRHSDNDLSIGNSAISRQHLKIELFSHIYTVTDVGSTLGTTLNGEKLDEPKVLKNGDLLLLGDDLEIEIVLDEDENAEEDSADVAPPVSSSSASASAGGGSSVPNSVFYLAPLFGLFLLLGVGGLVIYSSSSSKPENDKTENDGGFNYSNDRRKNPDEDILGSGETPTKTVTPETKPTNETTGNDPPIETSTPDNSNSTPKGSEDLAKIEVSSAKLLQKIAQNDPKAFLTGGQQQIVKARIDQLKNSSALAANIKSAKANAARITAIANEKNVKPQFLAVAAIAKMGNSSGDVAATAQNMADVLDEMSRNVGTERADDALLTIASYEQGVAGKTLEMRNMLQGLESKFPGSSRRIRTIWFLKEKNLITDAQFQAALTFLAVGTIAQNPKDFGVSADALNL